MTPAEKTYIAQTIQRYLPAPVWERQAKIATISTINKINRMRKESQQCSPKH